MARKAQELEKRAFSPEGEESPDERKELEFESPRSDSASPVRDPRAYESN